MTENAERYLSRRYRDFSKKTGFVPVTILVSHDLFKEFDAGMVKLQRIGEGEAKTEPPILAFRAAKLYANEHLQGRNIVISPLQIPWDLGSKVDVKGTYE